MLSPFLPRAFRLDPAGVPSNPPLASGVHRCSPGPAQYERNAQPRSRWGGEMKDPGNEVIKMADEAKQQETYHSGAKALMNGVDD